MKSMSIRCIYNVSVRTDESREHAYLHEVACRVSARRRVVVVFLLVFLVVVVALAHATPAAIVAGVASCVGGLVVVAVAIVRATT